MFEIKSQNLIYTRTDLKGIITQVSDSFCVISGYSREELIGQPHNIVRSPDISSLFFKNIWATIESKKSWNGEIYNKRKDGSIYCVDSVIEPLLDENDTILGYQSFRFDITERKKSEKVLFEVSNNLSNITQNVPGMICTFQLFPDGRSCFPYASEQIYDIYGVTPDEVKEDASKVFRVMHPDDLENITKSIEISMRELSVWEIEFRVNHPQKGTISLKGYAKPQKQPDGSVVWYSYVYDITEKKEIQNKLQESNQNLQIEKIKFKIVKEQKAQIELALKFGNIGIWEWDIDTNSLVWDDHMYEIYEIENKKEFPPYQLWFDAISKEDQGRISQIVANIVNTKDEFNAKFWITTPQNKRKYIHAIGKNEFDKDGKAYKMVGVNIDITEHQNLIELVQEQQDKYLKFATEGIFILNSDGKLVEYNLEAQNLLGYSSEEMKALYVYDFDVSHTKEEAIEVVKNVPITPIYVETKHRRKDGSVYDADIKAVKMKIGDDEFIYSSVRDITLHNMQSKLIREQKENLEDIFNNSQDAIGILNLETRFLEFNDAYILMSGYPRDELLEKSCMEMTHPDDIVISMDAAKKVEETGYIKNFEKRCFRKDGTIATVLISMFLLQDKKRILVNAKDITEQKLLYNDLLKAKIGAEKATASQAKFLANMSHEIRTPMNGILGFSRILKETLEDEEQIEYASMIETSGSMLLEIINDILDISKIQSGNMTLDLVNFQLESEMDHIKKLYTLQATEKSILLDYKIDSDLQNREFRGDSTKLKQVLSNLLNNAVKFTPHHGTVLFAIEIVEDHNKQTNLKFRVKDNGIGITKEKQIDIFEPFRQENESTTREFGGTGLGLAISKELVFMLGGELFVESEKDKGSEFYFTIPLVSTQDKIVKQIPKEKKQFKGKVLVAEDVEINQKLIRVLLAQQGLDTFFASNGVEVIEIYKKSYQELDIVILDINMPIVDGVEALKQIRGFQQTKNIKNIPMIALTANAIGGDKERFLNDGFDDYLSKPINVEELKRVLGKYLTI